MKDAAALLALADAVERAAEADTGSLLIEAFDLISWRSQSDGRITRYNPHWMVFDKLVRAGGYLDAAMMLVTEGWGWSIRDTGYARLISPKRQPDDREGFAATPAVALTAAALRAHAAIAGEG